MASGTGHETKSASERSSSLWTLRGQGPQGLRAAGPGAWISEGSKRPGRQERQEKRGPHTIQHALTGRRIVEYSLSILLKPIRGVK